MFYKPKIVRCYSVRKVLADWATDDAVAKRKV